MFHIVIYKTRKTAKVKKWGHNKLHLAVVDRSFLLKLLILLCLFCTILAMEVTKLATTHEYKTKTRISQTIVY